MTKVYLLALASITAICSLAQAAAPTPVPLAVVCTDANRHEGDLVNLCTTHSLKRYPAANDLVRPCPLTGCVWSTPPSPTFVLKKFGELVVTEPLDSAVPLAATDVFTPSDQNDWSGVAQWDSRLKSEFMLPTVIPSGHTATVSLRITVPIGGDAHTGFKVYSRVVGGTFGLIKTIPNPVEVVTDLPGYGPGSYEFTATAYNADGESVQLTPAPLQFTGTAPPAGSPPNPPASISIISVTISGG